MTSDSIPSSPHNPHRGRLFRKYLLLILSLMTMALLVSGGISLYFSYKSYESALASLQYEKAIGAASRIEQYIRQVSQQLSFAALPQLDAGDVEQRRIEFLKLLRQAPEVTDIAQIDASGREQIAVSRLGMDIVASGRDRSAEPAFANAQRGKPWFGPVYFRKETEPYMTVAIRSGSDKGPVTVAEVNLKFIWDVVSRIKIGDKGKAYVVDGNGLLVADPDIGLVLRKTNLAALAHVKAAATARSADDPAMFSHDLAGTQVLASMAPIEPLDWKVFVEQPVSEVYAKLNASILWMGALLLGGLAVSALAASALARSMVRPIRTLDEGARRIGEGDLEQQIVIKTGDELEGLADQFNRMSAQLRESYAGLERKVEQRTAELSESLEYQTAISEVLRVISQSTSDVVPVFDAIMESAVRLFDAPLAAIFRHDGRLVHLVGTRGWSAEAIEDARRLYPAPPNPQLLTGRIVLSGQAATVADIRTDPAYDATTARVAQWRRMIGAPMLKDGASLGVVVVAWPDPGPTPQRQTDLLETFADQAVIAIENVRLFNETQQSLERQTATAEILKVISASPTDVQPVFDAIAKSAQRLVHGFSAIVTRVVDGHLHLVALTTLDPSKDEALRRRYPMPVTETIAGEVVATKAAQVVSDTETDPRLSDTARQRARNRGYRSYVGIPMLRDGVVIGTMSVSRLDPGPYTDDEVALLQTFADQAVIAIENVRLFNETKAALERQTATADILRVIAGSPSDVQPVLDAIVRSAARLFGRRAALRLVEGGMLRRRATSDANPGGFHGAESMPIDRENLVGAVALDCKAIQVEDTHAATAPPYVRANAGRLSFRAIASVPLARENTVLGVLSLSSPDPGRLSADQMALMATFADQAVIAIENVRLFNETREALEQQTATGDILRVISGSVTQTQPVFDAIVQSCQRLFDGKRVALVLPRESLLEIVAVAQDGPPQASPEPWPIDSGSAAGTCMLESRVVSIADTEAAETAFPRLRQLALAMGYGSGLWVPLLREGKAMGCIAILRGATGGFDDKQIALARTFADQAVIAIENARLFNETKEALEQQTATAEILRVIGKSVSDTGPVFDKILDSCQGLFATSQVGIFIVRDDGQVHFGAYRGAALEAVAASFPQPVDQTVSGLAIRERRTVHVPDLAQMADMPAALRRAFEKTGNSSLVWAPMVWEDRGVGSIFVARQPPSPFTDKEISLLTTFADQAVIAIQNSRLFHEIEDKSLQLEKANKHKSEFLANMSHELRTPLNAIIGFSEVLSEGMFGDVNDKQVEYLRDIHSSGHHLLRLINDILDLSKIEAGRMELDLSRFHLPLLLDNSATLLRERASRQRLHLALDVEAGLAEWVADERKIKQVVINLLSNAVKFTPAGGSVTLRARSVECGVEIAVVDTGVGIAADQQALVFEEFRQAGGDYLRKSEGTGLGLSLAKRFVELHGGTIHVVSEPGQGSTFAFVLPERTLEFA